MMPVFLLHYLYFMVQQTIFLNGHILIFVPSFLLLTPTALAISQMQENVFLKKNKNRWLLIKKCP